MLHFEVQIKCGQRSDHIGSVRKPSQLPAFVLVHNDDWNDYGWYTWFSLFYFEDEHQPGMFIGELKLLCRDEEDTYSIIKGGFDGMLSEDFCSLGIDSYYYRNMHEVLQDDALTKELLRDLRDCATNYKIYEAFCDNDGFKTSLLRDLSAEKAYREARFLLSGEDESSAYSFDYTYHPVYDKQSSTLWQVHFDYDTPQFLRCAGIIGVNGAGKTQILRQMIRDLLNPRTPNFNHTPLYNCCIAISSTPLDGYMKLEKKNPRIEYYPCSLEQDWKRTEEKLCEAIGMINERPTVHRQSMLELYIELLDEHLGSIVEDMFVTKDNGEMRYTELNRKRLTEIVHILSSGQLHIMSLITHICAKIHFSSLLVIDEPEVHLHPKTMMDFMTTLCDLLDRFESFAIISTHSPLIVREMVNCNVFLMQQLEGRIPSISTVPFDCFGEDVTTLYCKIFGYDESNSYFRNLVKKMIMDQKSYEEVTDELEGYMDLSLNARLTIRDVYNEMKREE